QRHAAQAAELVNLMRRMATEIHVATGDFTVRGGPKPVEDRGPDLPGTSAVRDPAAPRAATDSAATPRGRETMDSNNVAAGPPAPNGRGARGTAPTVQV